MVNEIARFKLLFLYQNALLSQNLIVMNLSRDIWKNSVVLIWILCCIQSLHSLSLMPIFSEHLS